jgi:hypothetical protein
VVVPWGFSRLGNYAYEAGGVDSVTITELGATRDGVSGLVLPGLSNEPADTAVSDLDGDGQWELQARYPVLEGGYYLRFLIQPNQGWRLQYSSDHPFYAGERVFYDRLWEVLFAGALDYSKFQLREDRKPTGWLELDGQRLDIMPFFDEESGEFRLGRLRSFQGLMAGLQLQLEASWRTR